MSSTNFTTLKLIFAIAVTCLCYLKSINLKHSQEPSNLTIDLSKIAIEIDKWKMTGKSQMSLNSRQVLKLDQALKRTYSKDKNNVFVYIGYWTKQTGDYQAAKHSPKVCLPANGYKILNSSKYSVKIDNHRELVFNKVIAELRKRKFAFYYLFFSGNTFYTNEWEALINIGLNRLSSGRSDGGLLEVSTLINDETNKQSDTLFEDFIKGFFTEFEKEVLTQG